MRKILFGLCLVMERVVTSQLCSRGLVLLQRPHRPLAKSPGFHPGESGSIPDGVTGDVHMKGCDTNACSNHASPNFDIGFSVYEAELHL